MSINLGSIATGVRIKAPKVGMYGVGGIGKTSWAAGAPNAVFLFTEEGQGSMDLARFEPTPGDPVLRTWAQVMGCVSALYTEEHGYETVVIDSLDFLEPLLWKHTCDKWHQSNIDAASKEFGYGRGYSYAVDEAKALFQGLEALRNDKNMAIILICHHMVKQFKSPDTEPYDRYRLRLQEKFADYVHDWLDALLFANFRAHVVKDDPKNTGKGRARGVGMGERIVYTEARPAFQAKNRYGLQPEIELSWAAFVEGMKPGSLPEATTPTTKKDT